MKKKKIVWICHFSNAYLQQQLKPLKKTNEYSSWITALIKIFKSETSFNLHIITPHRWISGYKEYQNNNLNYHVFNPGIPMIGKNWPYFFPLDIWTNYFFNKMIVSKIIKKIKPDLIHLWGQENAYYSSTILQFKNKYPVIISIQGFVGSIKYPTNINIQKRIKVEKEIFKNFNNYFISCYKMKGYILKFNPNANFFYKIFPNILPNKVLSNSEKEFDIVFYSHIKRDKGIEDLFNALSLLKKRGVPLKLLVMGNCNRKYLNYLNNLINKLQINELVIFKGFVKTQNELFKEASKAKIFVLPTHHDILASSVRECMYLKIPVIVNNVGCFYIFNEKKQCVLLTKTYDVIDLSNKIEMLLNDNNLYRTLQNNAYDKICEIVNYDNIKLNILQAYQKVLNY